MFTGRFTCGLLRLAAATGGLTLGGKAAVHPCFHAFEFFKTLNNATVGNLQPSGVTDRQQNIFLFGCWKGEPEDARPFVGGEFQHDVRILQQHRVVIGSGDFMIMIVRGSLGRLLTGRGDKAKQLTHAMGNDGQGKGIQLTVNVVRPHRIYADHAVGHLRSGCGRHQQLGHSTNVGIHIVDRLAVPIRAATQHNGSKKN